MKFFVQLIFCCFISSFIQASWEVDYLPAVAYSPETSFMFGGVAVLSNGESDIEKNSTLTAVAVHSVLSQTILSVKPSLAFFSGFMKLKGKLHYSYYPKQYFGLGNHTDADLFEGITEDKTLVFLDVGFRVWTKTYLLIGYHLESMDILGFENGGLFDGDNNGHSTQFTYTGYNLGLEVDTRDNTLFSLKGFYGKFNILSIKSKDAGVSSIVEKNLDLRFYLPLGEFSTLAWRSFLMEVTGEGVPLVKMAQLGGSNLGRGYYRGRFREKSLAMQQVALRSQFGRLGGALFASSGAVAPELTEVLDQQFHHAYGAGLMYFLNKQRKSLVRLDVGISESGLSVYFDVSQAF